MKHTLIFATGNAHKVAEVKAIAGDTLNIISMIEAGFGNVQLEETATTLRGNALQKADILSDYTGLDCFAEDTGLEVDALAGAPGVYTARYAGQNCTPADNLRKLLSALEGLNQRTARFRTVIVLILDQERFFFEGVVEGSIALQPGGEGGFGYDPVFIPEGYTKTFAELPPEIKNTLSHRARAVMQMRDFLNSRDE